MWNARDKRRNGEVFLAHVWLSTYRTSEGPGLAAVVWDACENLRDREGAGLDSMMATSRVLIGAIVPRDPQSGLGRRLRLRRSGAARTAGATDEQYQALGSLIQGLEKIASSGLRAASAAAKPPWRTSARCWTKPASSSNLPCAKRAFTLMWDVAASLPLVQADHHSLLQVFVNLARNSEQALEDAPLREVRISAAVESDLVLVRFRDTGPGVAHPEELFRPFQAGRAFLRTGTIHFPRDPALPRRRPAV